MAAETKKFRFPRIDEHCAVLGTTGSGKTVLASYILSRSAFDLMPYICVDYKGDDLIGSIERIKEIGLRDRIPREPGLYVVRPLPSDIDATEDWLWRVWEQGNTGLFVDEAYLLPNKSAITNILAQGRSMRIPTIFASQRPVIVPRSVFTEASHLAVFRLNDRRDKKTVGEFTPDVMDLEKRLPDYHFHWYNVKDDWHFVCRPVPSSEEIVETINERLAPKVQVS